MSAWRPSGPAPTVCNSRRERQVLQCTGGHCPPGNVDVTAGTPGTSGRRSAPGLRPARRLRKRAEEGEPPCDRFARFTAFPWHTPSRRSAPWSRRAAVTAGTAAAAMHPPRHGWPHILSALPESPSPCASSNPAVITTHARPAGCHPKRAASRGRAT